MPRSCPRALVLGTTEGWRPHVTDALIMRFEDYSNPNMPYMFHCHMLQHEDRGMMGQFVVAEPGQSAGTIKGENHEQ